MSVSPPVAVIIRRRIAVRGIVQGVGFRPLVWKLARSFDLSGCVFNTSSGVVVEVEGAARRIEEFAAELRRRPPPLARIDEMLIDAATPTGERGFTIRRSEEEEREFTPVVPDAAVCDDCLRELFDPADRRHLYPFTNCTNCGPRYTIVRDIPYDRSRTTMAAFPMCADCQAEYHDPASRRFHAQPNACPRCGPGLSLIPRDGDFAPRFTTETAPLLETVRRVLREGAIVALRGLGGFHLACDAENDAAVRALRERKRRSDKPFALMVRDVAAAREICEISELEEQVLAGRERPIVILRRREGSAVAASIAPGNPTAGVMLPYTPLHHLLFAGSPEVRTLVMTSGNVSEEPIVTTNEEAWRRLRDIADLFVLHNREIETRVDDSVVRVADGRPRLFRRARSFAPRAVDVGIDLEPVLACGAELKNTICLTRRRYAFLSQHLGDAGNYETLRLLEETVGHMKRLFRIEPQAVAHDLHPRYLSSRFAREYAEASGLPLVGVQHHHAHVASCMAEHGLRGPIIGVALDGTGHGTDGTIWGGEFLVATLTGFERRAAFRTIPLAGGDMAVRQPWRAALAWLREAFGEDIPRRLPLFDAVRPQDIGNVETMLERRLSVVETSSCGRLFDAVASIIGLRQEVTFEAQAAIELEMLAGELSAEPYEVDIEDGRSPWAADFRPAIRALTGDVLRGVPGALLAARFHQTVALAITRICDLIRGEEGLSTVCMSGGCFQNLRLLEAASRSLRQRGFTVFLNSEVPANDGGISLGQALVASETLRQGRNC